MGLPGVAGPAGVTTINYYPIQFLNSLVGGSGSTITSSSFGNLQSDSDYYVETYVFANDPTYSFRLLDETPTVLGSGTLTSVNKSELETIVNKGGNLSSGMLLEDNFGIVKSNQGSPISINITVENLDVSDSLFLRGYAIVEKVDNFIS
jgi:hypothetical protein